MPTKSTNPSPIRIYILWHPGLDELPQEWLEPDPVTATEEEKKARAKEKDARTNRGLKLARRIYHWFRMENMDGIPVYFRSAPRPDGDGILPAEIRAQKDVRNYIIPLVDANMVSSPEWREYVTAFAKRDDDASKNPRIVSDKNAKTAVPGEAELPVHDCRVFPVAMESVAYNMPEKLRKLNYIRHAQTPDQPLPDDAELLAKLTEVLCRDLRYWLLRETHDRLGPAVQALPPIPAKIRIFLSHAKADDTDEALAIKEHIQKNTQCEAFFDETDIASGFNYAEILENAVSNESAGLIVIQGDNYADRPWCRKEIRDFLKPLPDPLSSDDPHCQYFIPPVVVVQTMKGKQIARTIPELGYSPCVRWNGNAAGFVVTTLLREILFGLFYRVLADRIASSGSENHEVFINRAPDPVMVSRILKELLDANPDAYPSQTIIHPGYGLSKMEMEGLRTTVRGIKFQSFLARTTKGKASCGDGAPGSPEHAEKTSPEDHSQPFAGRIIAVSAGTSEDILAYGQSDEHMEELLMRLLRPFVSSGASLLYGGKLPETFRPADPWKSSLNFTALLLSLLLSERETTGAAHVGSPRLYLPVPWHSRKKITSQDIAQWLDICSFLFMAGEDTGIDLGIPIEKPVPPDPDDLEVLSPAERHTRRRDHEKELKAYENVQCAMAAVSFSAMRKKICEEPLQARLLDDSAKDDKRPVETFAHILIGGAKKGFKGIMPGIYEEALYAMQAKKPLFIIGACGGAAAVLAQNLVALAERGKKPDNPSKAPVEFTAKHYEKQEPFSQMLEGIEHRAITCNPNDSFKELWTTLGGVYDPASLAALLNNGLTGEENLRLLGTPSFGEVFDLVWKGCSKQCSYDK